MLILINMLIIDILMKYKQKANGKSNLSGNTTHSAKAHCNKKQFLSHDVRSLIPALTVCRFL